MTDFILEFFSKNPIFNNQELKIRYFDHFSAENFETNQVVKK